MNVNIKVSSQYFSYPAIALKKSITNTSRTKSGKLYLAIKRVKDFSAAITLMLLLSPMFAVIALLIKLTSKGPVFYWQARHGVDHKIFYICKFRSMYTKHCDSTKGGKQACQNDDRVTPIGKILRKTSIDELPQLYNVLVGDMALVGPRPHAVDHNESYRSILPIYDDRHTVKLGITGLAQVNGARGETRKIEDMRKRLAYDIEYTINASLWQDIKIIFATALIVFKTDKAY